MRIYTIGFTRKTAEQFFGSLRGAGIRLLLDVRLRNSSQLAGFTRAADLPFFLREICQAAYRHEPLLAPTDELLDAYRGGKLPWPDYVPRYRELLAERQVEQRLDRAELAGGTVLLCSEPTADRCHRRLALEYLQEHWGDLEILHLA